MDFNTLYNPHPSARASIFAGKGMVATSHPLAAQAGLDVLKKGGNAIDAAIATAACLTVVEPTSNGIGGDAFALVWSGGKLHGLNSSGRSPESISIEKLQDLGHKTMPRFGVCPVNVPGVPGAWAALAKRFGKLSLADNLAPAVDYARFGHPVAPFVGKFWRRAWDAYKTHCTGAEFENWFKTFASNKNIDVPPTPGEIWKSSVHAGTLEEIGASNAKSFYTGALAKQMTDFLQAYGGFLTQNDLAAFKPEWVDPISVNYHGHDVWQLPPNGQGIIGLIALNILANFELKDDINSYHIIFEAMKQAFSAGKAAITDPVHMTVTVNELLSKDYAKQLADKMTNKALEPVPTLPNQGGTVYLCCADNEGNMVSYIQSNYMGFGSGLVVPGTGIALQNRGADFSLDPAHINTLKGSKLTYHTIIPGFLTKNAAPIGPFGVMGGYMQPQGHLQVMLSTIHGKLNPQQALDAPRWQWMEGKKFEVEHHFPRHVISGLVERGHQIVTPADSGSFGRGQIIWRDEFGTLCGGTESRCDGHIASY